MKTIRAYTSHLVLTASVAVLWEFTLVNACVHASPPQYSVTDLGTLDSGTYFGEAINASGQIAGWYFLAGGGNHTVEWTGTTPTDLGTLGGSTSLANSINASGQVVGTADLTGNSASHAVRWTGTTSTDLGALPGGNSSQAESINDSGQVAGYSRFTTIGSNYQHAVRWTGTTPTDLGTIGSTLSGTSSYSYGYGINASGQVAGYSDITVNDHFHTHAVLWTGTTSLDLGTLPGGSVSEGFGINDSGQVVGWSYYTTGTNIEHAVRWTGTTSLDLGTLGGSRSDAYGINAAGDVVGLSQITGDVGFDAFLFTGGTMYDLSTLLVLGSGVTNLRTGIGNSINNIGEIAAYGTIGGQTHALRLTPTPEPSTWAMLAAGTASLLALRRRKRE